jgi:methylglutaconyl-CoA hydratase
MQKEPEAYVKLLIENSVGYIEFFHPNRNSMPSDILSQLAKTITDAGKNPAITVIVLKSGGDRTFCAGASFNEVIAVNDAKTGEAFFSGFAHVINAMRTCPKLIIGRVQGKTVGGGVGLVAATDFCYASQHASIRLSELSIGIGPFVIEPAVSRKIGLAAMSQMTIDAETFFSAEWAKEKGLYAEVFETVEALDEAVKNLAEKLSTYNPEALEQMKTVFWKGTENWDTLLIERAKISGKLVLSDFTKTTLKRFR